MGRPKALLRYGEGTFLESILKQIDLSLLDGAVVVLGHHRDEILARREPARWVYNADYSLGMTTSFQAGIRAIPRESEGAMLFLVDSPTVDAATINRLVGAFRRGHIVIPVHHGRRGHPVLFSREALDEVAALSPEAGANQVVRREPGRVIHVPVEAAGVLADIDTPEEYERLRGGDPFVDRL
jgi:molybdenum cofactor cytidylyltransferase